MELTLEEKSFIVHGVAGTGMGVVCGILGTGAYLGLIAVITLYVIWFAFRTGFDLDPKDHGTKWWLGVGIWPYMVFWLFTWALVYYIRTGPA